MLTRWQIRAARALVGWSRDRLAAESKVPSVTIGEFETGKTDPRLTTVGKLQRALERAGVRFLDADDDGGPGLRFKNIEILEALEAAEVAEVAKAGETKGKGRKGS
jgi:transcriptional regulator with XRE-family HTH domain